MATLASRDAVSTSPDKVYVEGSMAAARPGSPHALLRRAFERAFNRPAPAGVRVDAGWDDLSGAAAARATAARGSQRPSHHAASSAFPASNGAADTAAACGACPPPTSTTTSATAAAVAAASARKFPPSSLAPAAVGCGGSSYKGSPASVWATTPLKPSAVSPLVHPARAPPSFAGSPPRSGSELPAGGGSQPREAADAAMLFVGPSNLGAVVVSGSGVVISDSHGAAQHLPCESITEVVFTRPTTVAVATNTNKGVVRLELAPNNVGAFLDAVKTATEGRRGGPCSVRTGDEDSCVAGWVNRILDDKAGTHDTPAAVVQQVLTALGLRLGAHVVATEAAAFCALQGRAAPRAADFGGPVSAGVAAAIGTVVSPAETHSMSPSFSSSVSPANEVPAHRWAPVVPPKPAADTQAANAHRTIPIPKPAAEVRQVSFAAPPLGVMVTVDCLPLGIRYSVCRAKCQASLPRQPRHPHSLTMWNRGGHCGSCCSMDSSGFGYGLRGFFLSLLAPSAYSCTLFCRVKSQILSDPQFPELDVSVSLPNDKSLLTVLGALREMCTSSGVEHNIPAAIETMAVTVTLFRPTCTQPYGIDMGENDLIAGSSVLEGSPAEKVGLGRLAGWHITHVDKQAITTKSELYKILSPTSTTVSLRYSVCNATPFGFLPMSTPAPNNTASPLSRVRAAGSKRRHEKVGLQVQGVHRAEECKDVCCLFNLPPRRVPTYTRIVINTPNRDAETIAGSISKAPTNGEETSASREAEKEEKAKARTERTQQLRKKSVEKPASSYV